MRGLRSRWLLVAAVCFAFVVPLQAAGALTVTSTTRPGGVTRYTFAWTANSSGAVSGHPVEIRAGYLLQVKFVPSGGGTAPTDEYDVTLVDEDGIDLLVGEGADLSNTAATFAVPVHDNARVYLDGSQRLDLTVAAAGDSKKGTVIVWVQ